MLIIRNLNLISIQSWAYMEMKECQFVLKNKKEFQYLLFYFYPFQVYINLQSFTDSSYVNVDNAVRDKVSDEAIL